MSYGCLVYGRGEYEGVMQLEEDLHPDFPHYR